MDLCRSFWRPLAILRFCPRQDSKKVMKVMMISPPPGPLRQGGGGWDPVKGEGVVSGHLAHSCQEKSGWASGARERLHTRATWVSPGPCKEEGQHGGLPIEDFPGQFEPRSLGYSGEISRHGHGVVTVGGRLAERTWFSRRIHRNIRPGWFASNWWFRGARRPGRDSGGSRILAPKPPSSRQIYSKELQATGGSGVLDTGSSGVPQRAQQSCGAAKFSVGVTLGHLPSKSPKGWGSLAASVRVLCAPPKYWGRYANVCDAYTPSPRTTAPEGAGRVL
eukprot:gene8733-biopygen10681